MRNSIASWCEFNPRNNWENIVGCDTIFSRPAKTQLSNNPRKKKKIHISERKRERWNTWKPHIAQYTLCVYAHQFLTQVKHDKTPWQHHSIRSWFRTRPRSPQSASLITKVTSLLRGRDRDGWFVINHARQPTKRGRDWQSPGHHARYVQVTIQCQQFWLHFRKRI